MYKKYFKHSYIYTHIRMSKIIFLYNMSINNEKEKGDLCA